MKKVHALLFAFLMITMYLTGYLSGGAGEDGSEGPAGADGEEGAAGPVGEAGSSLHLVVTADELTDCNTTLLGQIFFVSGEGAFQVCSTTGWAVVDLTGPAGTEGADGNNGSDGVDGTNGTDGSDGTNGIDGLTTLAVTTTLSEGNPNCPDGGLQIDVGIDDDDNGTLDAVEIDQTTYICDGTDGQDGANGADGTNGSASPNTMLTSISSPHATMGCDAGGRVIEQGLDNGDGGGTAQNGVLESGEVDYTTTYCSKYVIWQVADISSGWDSYSGFYMQILVGDTLYFSANDGSDGFELWAHDTSNSSTWQVADIRSGWENSNPGYYMHILVGDTLYFSADDGSSGHELWAHDTSNSSTWQVTDISTTGDSNPGQYLQILVGDTLYFSASDGSSGHELWAMDIEHSITYN